VVGLLMSALRADVDRLLHSAPAADSPCSGHQHQCHGTVLSQHAGSDMLTAGAGSKTQTCFNIKYKKEQ